MPRKQKKSLELKTHYEVKRVDPNLRLTFVKNAVGTSRFKCQCKFGQKSWLGHWERGTGEDLPEKCCAKYCRHRVQVGAHVKIFGESQKTSWIIPFCHYHNKRPDNYYIELKPGVMLCGAARIDCV